MRPETLHFMIDVQSSQCWNVHAVYGENDRQPRPMVIGLGFYASRFIRTRFGSCLT